MATKSKLELAVDAGKWEDGLRKAQSSMKAFEQSIGGLEKATSSEKEKMAQFIQILGNTKSSAATASQQVKEYRSTIERLQVISTKLNGEQKKLAEEAMAKMTRRMQEAKGQADQLNQSMNGMSSSGNDTGSVMDQLAGKFGLTTKQLAGFGAALAVGKTALDVAKDSFFQTESGIDNWGRAVKAGEGAYSVFLDTINNGNWSNFFDNLNDAINGSIELYNALDRLGSIKANNAVVIATEQKALAEARLQLKDAQAKGDKAEEKRIQELIKTYEERLAGLRRQESDATKNAGQKSMTETIRNGARSVYYDVSFGEVQAAITAIKRDGQAAFDKFAREYKQLKKAGMTESTTSQYTSSTGQTYERTIEGHFDIEKLTTAQKRQYAIAKAVTEGETRIQEGLALYAQGIEAETNTMNEQFRYNRQAGLYGKNNHSTTTKPEPIIPEGSIAEAESKIKELQERWRNATTQDDRNSLSEQLKEANVQLDIMKGKVEEVKMPEMNEGISGMNAKAMSARETDIKTRIQLIEPGTEEMAAVKENLKDLGTIKAVLDYTDIVDIDMAQLEGMMADIDLGLDIPDEQWQAIVDEINEQLASLNLPPIELNVETGGLDKVTTDTKDMQSAWAGASKAIGAASSALGQIEDPGAKIAGIIGSALATLAQTFAMSMKGTVTPWDWIAAGISGAATLESISGVVKQSVEYHSDGGMVGSGPFVPRGTDTVPAMLTPGEIVLSAANQKQLAENLQGTSNIMMQSSGESRISGEDLVTVINAYGRRTGRGEILK